MTETTITLSRDGLHARPAAQLVQIANQHRETSIKYVKDGKEADGRSLLSIMGLGAGQGSTITVRTDGPGESEAMAAIMGLLQQIAQ